MIKLRFFDANVFLGKHDNPYAVSPFTVEGASRILQTPDGISEMLVYHSAAKLYDASYGNQLLIKEAKNQQGLYLIQVILPEFTASESDASKVRNEMLDDSFAAAKIFCHTHNFMVENHSLDPLLARLEEKLIPLLVDQEEITWQGLEYVLRTFASLPVILTNVGYRLGRFVEPFLHRHANLYLEISRYQVHRGIENLCNRFGSERLLFGSGLPIFSPQPAMMMVESAAIRDADKINIAGANLRRLLRGA